MAFLVFPGENCDSFSPEPATAGYRRQSNNSSKVNSVESSSQSLPAGTRLEEFLIEKVLGNGGFGITYLARDTSLGRRVVIKENLPAQFCFRGTHSLTVAPRHTQGEDAQNFAWSLRNFSKEAATLASLDHPGIVKVHRIFEAFGTAYFVMPFVEGMTFGELIESLISTGESFDEEELREILTHLLDSLTHLHGKGIFHRDIKPGNILVKSDQMPLLIDFGSARQLLSERSMTVVESRGYTPFEQLKTRGNVGPWSDIYALGGTLYKALTFETPPSAADRTLPDQMTPLMDRADLVSRYSAEFLGGIDRAMAVKISERFQTAGDWSANLRKGEAGGSGVPVFGRPGMKIASGFPVSEGNPESSAKPGTDSLAPVSGRSSGEEWAFEVGPGIRMRFCWVPAGRFRMGSAMGESGRDYDEGPVRDVTITKGFWMGKYEVTQGEWEALMGRTFAGEREKVCGSGTVAVEGRRYPMCFVDWLDICGNENRTGGILGKLNKLGGWDLSGWRFDLPTEAQWEYACRAGTKGAFAGELDTMGWYDRNSMTGVHEVGEKMPNAWGLCDMHGNLWEWCRDWYGRYSRGMENDPAGPPGGDYHVIRGGGWFYVAQNCRSAQRGSSGKARGDIGFRIVLMPEPGG